MGQGHLSTMTRIGMGMTVGTGMGNWDEVIELVEAVRFLTLLKSCAAFALF